MNRSTAVFQVNDIDSFKQQMLNWANRFNIFIFLDSHHYTDTYAAEEWMLAADVTDEFTAGANPLTEVTAWLNKEKDWAFGHLGYDLKNKIEQLSSQHPDHIGFPDIYFFRPAILIRKKGNAVEIQSGTAAPGEIFTEITSVPNQAHPGKYALNVQSRFSKQEYLAVLEQLRAHILRGDCYEINFCQEFFAQNAIVDPLALYHQLVTVSPMPFGGFYKLNTKYLLCASPERFLQKKGTSIISQPIKGTIRRNTKNASADETLKQQLKESIKDQSENVMVVDLVRNDLSKICKEGTVQAEALYNIHSFPQVHQMISTVTGEIREEIGFGEMLEATFPMGSMTGAPKIRVMQLIEQYEKTKRGIYSGCIGYISPTGDFDFNVVIRSIMYNAASRYLSYQVGGGITFYSDAEKEYDECLLKAAAIKKVLQ